jgi:hypothetical protein
VQTSDKEVAMLTRSILEIIGEASGGVEIPEAHLKEGRASPMPDVAGGEQALLFRVKVRSSNSKPGANDVFVAAQYHSH